MGGAGAGVDSGDGGSGAGVGDEAGGDGAGSAVESWPVQPVEIDSRQINITMNMAIFFILN